MKLNLMERRADGTANTFLMERRNAQTAGLPSRFYPLFASLCFLLIAAPAYGQGLNRVNTLLDQVLGVLQAASLVVVTIAIIWAGYKFLFRNADIGEVVKIIGAGILIGGAAEIAALLLS